MRRITPALSLATIALLLLGASDLSAQWIEPTGPTGGAVNDLISTPSGLIAATSIGGVFRSTDDGATWREINHGALVPRDVPLLGYQPGRVWAVAEGGPYRLDDGALAWELDRNGIGNTHERVIRSIRRAGDVMFAGSALLYRRLSSANAWERLASTSELGRMAALAGDGERLVGSFESVGIRLSSDSGKTWREPTVPIAGLKRINGLVETGGRTIATHERGVDVSTDGGETWRRITTSALPNGAARPVVTSFGVVVMVEGGLAVTTDAGETWSVLSLAGIPGELRTEITALEAHRGALYAGTEGGGVFMTGDGATWRPRNVGLTNTWIPFLATIGTRAFAAAQGDGLWMTPDAGATWERVAMPQGYPDAVDVFANGDELLVDDASTWLTSTDNGATWRTLRGNAPLRGTLAIHNGEVIGARRDSLARRVGDRWTGIGRVPFDDGVDLLSHDGAIFLATARNGLHRSTDGGLTWERVGASLDYYRMSRLATIDDELFVAGTTGIHRSSDRGASWEDVTPPLADTQPVDDILVVGETMIAASFTDIFISADRGRTWRRAGGAHDVHFRSLGLVGETVLAGTEGNGVYRRTLADLLATSVGIGAEAALSSLRVDIGDGMITAGSVVDAVRARLYDAVGQVVAASDAEASGEIVLQGSWSAGFYLLEIVTERGSVVRPIVMTR